MDRIYLEITPFFPTEENFVGPYIYDQVKAIRKSGKYKVIVVKIVPIYSREPAEYRYRDIQVYNFKIIDLPSSVLPGLFHSINLIRFEKFLRKTLHIERSDIAFIHSHVAYPAGAIAVDFGTKYTIKNFVQHHGLDVMQTSNGRILRGKLKKLNDRFLKRRFLKTVNRTDLNIGVSQKVIDQLFCVDGYENPNTYVLYNGVDTSKFYPKAKHKDNGEFVIGSIGNFWKIKDQLTLLKALDILVNEKNIQNTKIIFVGSGAFLSVCKEYTKEHYLENFVEFRKEIDHSLLNDFYNSLDLFVLPSYYEALGCVYTEALQVGVPIIAVENQGIEELLSTDDKPKSLIPKKDYRKLASLIYAHMQRGNENKYKGKYDFNIDTYISKFLEKIESNV